jgi:hypothetical protein
MTSDNTGALDAAASQVAEEYRGGKLPDAGAWEKTWAALRAELERRCPGFAQQQYDQL